MVNKALDINTHISGYLNLPKMEIPIHQIRSVWYRRPKPFEISPSILKKEYREFALHECDATIKGIEYLLRSCLWVNHPHAIQMAANKIYQLKVARNIGFEIPATLVSNDPIEVKKFYERFNNEGKEVVIKVLNSGSNIHLLTRKLTHEEIQKSDYVRYVPCFLQKYVDKKLEVRITVVNKKIFAAEIHSQSSKKTKVDWRNQADDEEIPWYIHRLPPEIESKCISIVKEMGLIFGAIDMIYTPDGRYVFLEINPNGQWLWLERLTDLPISQAILDLLMSGKP